jgi:polysaccharide biosynthesis protein PslE
MLIEVTRANLAYIVFKKQRLIWLTALCVLVLAILYCIIATPKYEAYGALVVSFSPMPSGVPGDAGESANQTSAPVDHEEIINSYALQLQSPDLARQVISELGVEKVYPPYAGLNPIPYIFNAIGYILESISKPDATIADQRKVEDAADRFLKKDLKVEAGRNSNVIEVTLFNNNRGMAVEVAKRLINRFIDREGQINRDPRTDFIRGQVEVYRKHVADAQTAMEAFQLKNGISSMDEERTALIQQRSNLEQSIIAVHSRLVGDEKSYETLSKQLSHLSPVIATAQNDRDPLELTARTSLADLKAREAALEQAFAQNSQAIQDTRKNIKATEALLKEASRRTPLTHSEPNFTYQQLQVAMIQTKADLDAARVSEAAQRNQLRELNGRLTVGNLKEGAYQDAVRDYQLADQNYRLYLQGTESARIADDLNKQRITSIAVYDAPYASTKPAKPKVVIIIALGMIGGLLLGFGAAFMSEALDEALSTPYQVAEVLKLRVLGSMARI